MHEDDDDYIPGLHDDGSIPKGERVARYAAYLRDWIDFEMAIDLAASSSIELADLENFINSLQKNMEEIRAVEKDAIAAMSVGLAGVRMGRRYAEEVLAERERKKKALSKAGMTGAKVRHELSNRFKEWVLHESAGLRGADADIARKLATRIPGDFVDASKNPGRFIYETLRSKGSRKKTSS